MNRAPLQLKLATSELPTESPKANLPWGSPVKGVRDRSADREVTETASNIIQHERSTEP